MLPIQIQHLLQRDGWTLQGHEATCQNRRIRFFLQAGPEIAAIARRDQNRFRQIAVVVAPTNAALHDLRAPANAGKFPRAFFLSAEELTCESSPVCEQPRIASFHATVIANTPVGQTHYRLAFKAPQLHDLQAPQFFMMDTQPQRVPLGQRVVRRRRWQEAVDWMPQPLLKRPFGVCRDYHPYFPRDYLRRLVLPPSLAPFLHLPAPDQFEMLYKVLPDGIGTPRTTHLKAGDRVHMIGPLGKPLAPRQLRASGVEEVHIIGGGVGMAPLILLVEMLRLRGFRLKVFLGIATLESLRYRDELAATFGEKPRDAYLYVDDLLAAGVAATDIFLSFDTAMPRRVRNIPRGNLFRGLVPDQYRATVSTGANALAIACGPNQMMEMTARICRRAGIPLKVLLEKRMGCGIGVCFSCTQKIRRPDGSEDYVRVCTEGPLFDAKDIVWTPNDSTPSSANCVCAARC